MSNLTGDTTENASQELNAGMRPRTLKEYMGQAVQLAERKGQRRAAVAGDVS